MHTTHPLAYMTALHPHHPLPAWPYLPRCTQTPAPASPTPLTACLALPAALHTDSSTRITHITHWLPGLTCRATHRLQRRVLRVQQVCVHSPSPEAGSDTHTHTPLRVHIHPSVTHRSPTGHPQVTHRSPKRDPQVTLARPTGMRLEGHGPVDHSVHHWAWQCHRVLNHMAMSPRVELRAIQVRLHSSYD